MTDASKIYDIFYQSVTDWHQFGKKNQTPFPSESLEAEFYCKNQIDCGQWHLEDDIREPQINGDEVKILKQKIDQHNQDRTNLVEKIDDYYLEKFKNIKLKKYASLNTETPAWAIDRLSILALKIYHMDEESNRETASKQHREKCSQKLVILKEQKNDLIISINQLFDEYKKGKKHIKVYRQMKMYNDPNLNPVLYRKNEQ
jgi:hypothetical protein